MCDFGGNIHGFGKSVPTVAAATPESPVLPGTASHASHPPQWSMGAPLGAEMLCGTRRSGHNSEYCSPRRVNGEMPGRVSATIWAHEVGLRPSLVLWGPKEAGCARPAPDSTRLGQNRPRDRDLANLGCITRWKSLPKSHSGAESRFEPVFCSPPSLPPCPPC